MMRAIATRRGVVEGEAVSYQHRKGDRRRPSPWVQQQLLEPLYRIGELRIE